MRLRELGLTIGTGIPGQLNAITDVEGVRVGHTTLIEGDGPLVVGRGPVRTGVTVVLPHGGRVWEEPVFAGCHRLNGNGELTGLEWIRESGTLTSPIGLTNTHSVGTVRDALIASEVQERGAGERWFSLPVVGETYDGTLNDINGFHVKPDHVAAALARASDGPVDEGNVGSGTGMICHGFKGGIGTSSRVVQQPVGTFTVGVLVQANYGRRSRLQINGIAVGAAIPESEVPAPAPNPTDDGSIIVVVATDAPLLPNQCTRLAQRAGLGVARIGGVGEHFSGDLFIAFATGNKGALSGDFQSLPPEIHKLSMLPNVFITPLFDAVVEATEEAIVSALLAAKTMTGRDGVTAHALDPDRLVALLTR